MPQWAWLAFCVIVNDLLVAILITTAIRIWIGRPINMQALADLQAAVTALQADIAKLSAAGLIPASSLTAITATVQQLDTEIKALLPAGA
jgi:hypothetical protein